MSDLDLVRAADVGLSRSYRFSLDGEEFSVIRSPDDEIEIRAPVSSIENLTPKKKQEFIYKMFLIEKYCDEYGVDITNVRADRKI